MEHLYLPKTQKVNLEDFTALRSTEAQWNLNKATLIEEALANKEGILADTGALVCGTGVFTGRSPKDRYIVKDEETAGNVWWGETNVLFPEEKFDALLRKVLYFLVSRKLYIRDAYVGALEEHRINLRTVNTLAWHDLFCHNMFMRPKEGELKDFAPALTVICAPEFKADPRTDGTRQTNFSMISLSRKIILIGGTSYAGEIKKAVFTVLNYLLPMEKGVLSMHCAANIGREKDTAIFFGLSGTGKTTLSADADRKLIGDDEHGWDGKTIFNFEGGCYAKTIGLTYEKEPDIWNAVRWGAILENVRFFPGTRTVNYANGSITENTRTAYPIHHIANIAEPSVGGSPSNIFFLVCDAHGVLPPISKLTKAQAMYHFISGYTAKVAGTESGITAPQAVFSACFGAPFLPLHPSVYAKMLGRKMEEHAVNVWMVNTGWSGGVYGKGSRIKLGYTRALISAALKGFLDDTGFEAHSIFKVAMPLSCPGVPKVLVNPREAWNDKKAYDLEAEKLARCFAENFKKFEGKENGEILSGGPGYN